MANMSPNPYNQFNPRRSASSRTVAHRVASREGLVFARDVLNEAIEALEHGGFDAMSMADNLRVLAGFAETVAGHGTRTYKHEGTIFKTVSDAIHLIAAMQDSPVLRWRHSNGGNMLAHEAVSNALELLCATNLAYPKALLIEVS